MKQAYMMGLALLTMLICATLTIAAAPSVRLPTQLVTMNAQYGGASWFDTTLSDIPAGFDITDDIYQGWCVQKNIRMTQRVNHTVLLYSSDDPSLPEGFQNKNWDKINYLLNHKTGNRISIQKAIWYYWTNENCSTDINASAMIAAAEQNGAGFTPTSGDVVAIPIEGIPAIQLTFIELILPMPGDVGGLVWDDLNANGLQEKSEPGLYNVEVRLYQPENLLVNTTTTNIQGTYSFPKVATGEYYLLFLLPSGYRFSPQNRGSDTTLDSDVNETTGKTIVFPVHTNEDHFRWDAGMFKPSSESSGNGGFLNHPPTADGTAGEPYHGFVHTQITFDGSRSYDRDGWIISSLWDFGDGTTASELIVPHAYENPGTYPVVLTVTDNNGAQDRYHTQAVITQGNNPPTTPQLSGPLSGHLNVSYWYTIVSTDPDGDLIRYIFHWGDGTHRSSPPFESGPHIQTMYQWKAAGFYTIHVYAQDPHNATTEANKLMVSIDVLYVQNLGYLINSDGIGPYDLFYSNQTGKQTRVQQEQTGVYAIDVNGDGIFDYLFDVHTGELREYPEQFVFDDFILFATLGIVLLFMALLRFFGSRKHDMVLKHTGGRDNSQVNTGEK
jgi:PKD repeat protein